MFFHSGRQDSWAASFYEQREKSHRSSNVCVWGGGERKRGRERVCMCTLVGGGDRGRDGKSVCALVCVYTRAPSSGALDIEGYQET